MFDKKIEYQSNNEQPLFCDPAKVQEVLVNKFEDIDLNAIADARLNDGKPPIEVDLDLKGVGKRERNTVYRVAAKR